MRRTLHVFSILFLSFAVTGLYQSVQADVTPHQRLKKHVRDIVQDVKAAQTPAEKRAILDEELRTMVSALERAERMADLSSQDQSAVDALQNRLQAKLDELHGTNGYEAVPAGQLDAFADYVQQDFERANTVTISVTTALLIIILILLLA